MNTHQTSLKQNIGTRLARGVSRIVDPHGGPSDAKLRSAVQGKVILVTGASHGIGRAAAVKLGFAGATVLLVARSADELEAVRRQIEEAGGRAAAHPADLNNAEQVEQLAGRILADHGHVDVIVNNAGKSIRRSLELSEDRFHDFERTIGVNYLGPVKLLLSLLPSMRGRGQGHIVNVSTAGVRGLPPAPRWSGYQASKGAFDIFSRAAAPELRSLGITTTNIYMTLVHTRMSAPTPHWRYVPGLLPEEAADLVCRAIAYRPRVIGPWWRKPSEHALITFGRPVEAVLGAIYRRSGDGGGGEAHPGPAPGTSRRSASGPSAGGVIAMAVTVGVRSRLIGPVAPRRLPKLASALTEPRGLAALVTVGAARHPDRPALIDDMGTVTFAELDRRANSIAASLRKRHAVDARHGLAVMSRNHRGFVEAALAASRLGADLLLLNTEFSAPQIAQTLAGYELGAIVHDPEFSERFEQAGCDAPRVLALAGGDAGLSGFDELAATLATPPRGRRPGRIVMLTSGTTGAPKGAPRQPSTLALAGPALTALSAMRLRGGEPIAICPPFFHGFGFLGLAAGLALGSPVVMQSRHDAERTLAGVEQHGVTAVFAVPVMLQRMVRLPADARARHDTSSLRVMLSGAAPLSPLLAGELMDQFGEILYDGYGSTETGIVALATPADLRAEPSTVGRPPIGTTVKILGPGNDELPAGETGRIFVANRLLFDGYTGGGGKEMVDGAMSTGDLGHFDAAGRLYVDGREDDMIVSGGENVFPGEVEDVLAVHPAVMDVAVVGVLDDEFGQRLAAYVVLAPQAEVTADELREHVKSQLARFKAPRDIVFLDQLPRNPTGKLLRSELGDASAGVRA